MPSSDKCLFCRIANGEIPARKVYEDDQVFAFHDINPQAPTHILVIPRRHIPTLDDLSNDDASLVGTLVLRAAAAMQTATADGQSLDSVIDGAPSAAGNHPTGEHAGAATHDATAQHGHGVTTETSQVNPASQASHDEAERPAAASTHEAHEEHALGAPTDSGHATEDTPPPPSGAAG